MTDGGLRTTLIAVLLLAVGAIAEAQQAKKFARIGILTTGSEASIAHLLDGFKQRLRELGYLEGKNFAVDIRYGEGNTERLPGFAAELVSLKVDVIVAITNSAIEAAKRATQTIPIVMPIGSDPVGVGFAASLARPGGNITGLSAYSPELNGKRLELLKEIFPKLTRVALLMSPNIAGNANDLKETELAAQALRLRHQLFELRGSSDLDATFKAIAKWRAQAFSVFPGQPTLFVNRKQIVDLAAKNRLPAMYPLADYVTAGGLASYGVDNLDQYRRAANYVDRLLQGAKAAELPIEQPMKFEFVINLKTAKKIGLEIPQWPLMKADRVIK